jgi:hypothetical protein
MKNLRTKSAQNPTNRAAILFMLVAMVGLLAPTAVKAQTRLQAGTLACAGEGGWGLIITSKKTFRCTFSATDSDIRGEYVGEIRKFGLDVGVTGDTVLMWLVLGPAEKVGENYVPGSLQGEYAGIGAEASAGMGLGANALLGGGEQSFALQPVSVQVQTGLSIAAGVQTFSLEYVGPMQ